MTASIITNENQVDFHDYKFLYCLKLVFSNLSVEDLASVGKVCRIWRECSKAIILWEPHFRERGFLPPSTTEDWCKAYFYLRYGVARSLSEKGKKTVFHQVDTGDISIKSVAFSVNGALFATSSDKEICLWKTESRTLVKKFEERKAPVTSLSFFNRNGDEYLVTGSSEERTIEVWPVAEEDKTEGVRKIHCGRCPPLGEVVSSTEYIATCFEGKGTVYAWSNSVSGTTVLFSKSTTTITAIALRQSTLAAAFKEKKIELVTLGVDSSPSVIDVDIEISHLGFSGDYLVAGGKGFLKSTETSFFVWDLQNLGPVRHISLPYRVAGMTLYGGCLITVQKTHWLEFLKGHAIRIYVCDIDQGKLLSEFFLTLVDMSHETTSLAFNGEVLLFGDKDRLEYLTFEKRPKKAGLLSKSKGWLSRKFHKGEE